jgi:hypothetical protein
MSALQLHSKKMRIRAVTVLAALVSVSGTARADVTVITPGWTNVTAFNGARVRVGNLQGPVTALAGTAFNPLDPDGAGNRLSLALTGQVPNIALANGLPSVAMLLFGVSDSSFALTPGQRLDSIGFSANRFDTRIFDNLVIQNDANTTTYATLLQDNRLYVNQIRRVVPFVGGLPIVETGLKASDFIFISPDEFRQDTAINPDFSRSFRLGVGTFRSFAAEGDQMPATHVFSSRIDFTDVKFSFTTSTVGGVVPEPATWAMMILGFGVIGGAMRAQKKSGNPRRFRLGVGTWRRS